MGRLINVGCGEFPLPPPWENYDISPLDIKRAPGRERNEVRRGDARTLDYAGAEIVYAGHFVEHLLIPEARGFFRRVRSQAATPHELIVTVPAWDRCQYADWKTLQDMGGGEGRWNGDRHVSWWRTDDLRRELREAGYSQVHEYFKCPYLVADVPWQVCMSAKP